MSEIVAPLDATQSSRLGASPSVHLSCPFNQEVDVGVVGKVSLARPAQVFLHHPVPLPNSSLSFSPTHSVAWYGFIGALLSSHLAPSAASRAAPAVFDSSSTNAPSTIDCVFSAPAKASDTL